ncbi:hypothetical protein GCM10028803_29580 [Larkinella knui]|uniref:DUF4377 domain-containing protein n=1 Tax=Larkinella knui TaxID=2025310 RepID=A0A3P1CXN7_9BACT|nr:DUF4377 domain-containing protein [Larkinella knui]RRB17989.1 DUF4377 domain-containing protein [Larkinella knui]
MNRVLSAFYVGLFLLFSSCDKSTLKPDLITMQVADHYQDCTGVGPMKCLLVKIDGAANWTYHYFGIEGFNYEEGFEYKLTVKREKIDNPPADGSSIRYILVKVIEKIKT